jgi:ABC-type polysaccharide/polyol phosphate transport system ATPase subunit
MKCLERMRHIQQSGTTIVLVSHSMHAVCPTPTIALRSRMRAGSVTDGEL